MNTTLFKCGFKVPCDTYGCRSMADWYVGREDGPLNSTFKLCTDCAKHMVNNLPEELNPKKKEIEISDGQMKIGADGGVTLNDAEVKPPEAKKKAPPKKTTAKKSTAKKEK